MVIRLFTVVFLIVAGNISLSAQVNYFSADCHSSKLYGIQESKNATSCLTVPDLSFKNKNFTKPRPRFRKQRMGNNMLYIEGLGFGADITYYTVNYDVMLQSNERTALTARLGLGVWEKNMVVPLLVNMLIGSMNSIEIGFGGVYIDQGSKFNPAGDIGYRYQSPKGGFIFRIAFTPTIERKYNSSGIETGKALTTWGGLSIGWAF
jgi:hypothetical protein